MREEIAFYDYEFNPLWRAVNVTDIYHKELYNGIGSFEAGIIADRRSAELLLERDFTVAVWEGRQAIITSAQAEAAAGVVRIYGRTPNWLLSKRACPNFGHRTGTPFELAHALVDEVWGDAIAVGPGRDTPAKETTFWRNVYNPLSEVVADCLDRADGGHRVVFDIKNREWRFETWLGGKSPCLFSEDRRNISAPTLRHSVLDYFNGGYYCKDDEAGTWVEIPSDKEGIYRWTSRLDGSGEDSARSDLMRRRIEDGGDFDVLGEPNGAYALGDVVKAQLRLGGHGKTREMRVTAIERWAERGSGGERPLLEAIYNEENGEGEE